MSRKVLSRFNGGIAGLNLVVTCLLALAAIFAAPSLAKAASGQISTVNWRSSTGQGYDLEAMVVTNALATVKLSGPGMTEDTMYPVSNENGVTVYRLTVNRGTSKPQLGAAYTVKITYLDYSFETLTLPITAILGEDTSLGINHFPTPVAPIGSIPSVTPPTFYWSSPKTVPTEGRYSVTVTGPDLFEWSNEVPSSDTSMEYNGSALTPGAPYEWTVATIDKLGNRAEIRGTAFSLGASISGKATTITGSPLLNIEVRATEVTSGTTYPSVYTAADGTYLLRGLAPGRYKVDFGFGAYYYKDRLDAATADIIEVADGASISGINGRIGGWGALEGSVFVTQSYKPAKGKVELLDLNKVPVAVSPPTVPASVIQTEVTLNGSGYGEFYLAPIRPGTYWLRFSAPGYLSVDKQVVITENDVLDGLDGPWAMLDTLVPATLTVQTSGAGTGTVTSSPVGIACATGSTTGCSSTFSGTVTLNVTATAGSVFAGWSGACAGTSASCTVTLDTAKSVTASFIQKPATVSIVGDSTPYFSIGKAVDFLAANNVTAAQTVLAKALVIVEDVIMVAPGQVTFKGGYTDPESANTFNTRTTTSRTTIDGVLKIRKGKFIPERLAVK